MIPGELAEESTAAVTAAPAAQVPGIIIIVYYITVVEGPQRGEQGIQRRNGF